MKVKLKKISEAAAPKYRSADWEEYKCGQDNGDISLPIEYELTGELLGNLEVGAGILVERETRNGVECFGVFQSSCVNKITDKDNFKLIETDNSIYTLEDLG